MKGNGSPVLSVRISLDLGVAYNKEFTVHFILDLGSAPKIKSQLLIVIEQETTFQTNVQLVVSHTTPQCATMQELTSFLTKLEERSLCSTLMGKKNQKGQF